MNILCRFGRHKKNGDAVYAFRPGIPKDRWHELPPMFNMHALYDRWDIIGYVCPRCGKMTGNGS